MEHEFKIIIKMEEGAPIVNTSKVIVYLDDEPIGTIQDIKFQAGVESFTSNLEVTFPDLESDKIDPSYHNFPNLINTVKAQIERLKKFPAIKVMLKDLFT